MRWVEKGAQRVQIHEDDVPLHHTRVGAQAIDQRHGVEALEAGAAD
jgi:hypothetical protein